MPIQNCLERFHRFAGLAAALAGLGGCGTFESIVEQPARPGMATVQAYDTQLHRQSVHIFNPMPLDDRVAELRLQPRVQHLFFLLDQDPALSEPYRGVETRLYAREIVRRFARTLPEQGYSGALLVTGQGAGGASPQPQLQTYSGRDIEQALDAPGALQRIGADSLPAAIDRLSDLISGIGGSSAIILVTSWSQIDKSVEQAVMRLRQRNRFAEGVEVIASSPETRAWQGAEAGVCLYTLGVGNRLSRTRLESMDSCGYSVAADKVAQPRDMAHFVQRVLFKGPADADGDGIYDYQDRCPGTPAGRIVDYSGCLRFADQ
jgi:hypothetical protein